MRPILLILCCLTICGCAGINLSGSAPDAGPQPPDEKKLAELARTAFATAKLTGAPQVSSLRATHDNQWGEWVFCVKSAEASPAYAVLIGHEAILEVRTSVFIDGCDRETYSPLAVEPPAKAGRRK
ncbi:MAG: hypothetical protein J2P53_17405 [Bradyrhizobiaceae bacterium]|nr:hypothetical protein [Bradyrhizobiaceae bacterium]